MSDAALTPVAALFHAVALVYETSGHRSPPAAAPSRSPPFLRSDLRLVAAA